MKHLAHVEDGNYTRMDSTATLFLSIVCVTYKINKQDVEKRHSNLYVLRNIHKDTIIVRSLDQNII